MRHFLLSFSIFAVVSIFPAQTPSFVPNEGLVGWWGLDGDALDAGNFENHGSLNGASHTTNRYDEASGAVAFDGIDDYILIPDAPSLQITTDITISLWYKTAGPSGGYQTFVNKRSEGEWPYSFGLSHFSGPGGCPEELDKYVTSRRNNGSEFDVRVSEKTYVPNEWTHAAMTISNDTVTFYENGLAVGTACFGSEIYVEAIDQGAPLTLGSCNCGSSNEMMNGSLDDLGIWNRALSSEEVMGVFESVDNCSSYMTLTSTPSDCDASGSVTADVSECSTSISEVSPVMQALLYGFDHLMATIAFGWRFFHMWGNGNEFQYE